MRYLLTLIAIILVLSCGSRKVDKYSNSSSENISSSDISSAQIEVLQVTRDKLSSLIYEIEIRADNMTTDGEGNTTLTNPVITSKGNLSEESKVDSTNTKLNSESKHYLNSNKDGLEEGKKTDKKQFNWWLAMPPIVVVIAIVILYRYIKKRKSNGNRN